MTDTIELAMQFGAKFEYCEWGNNPGEVTHITFSLDQLEAFRQACVKEAIPDDCLSVILPKQAVSYWIRYEPAESDYERFPADYKMHSMEFYRACKEAMLSAAPEVNSAR